MTIRAILWDNDGVLVDTEGLYFQATREVLATVGVELGEEAFAELFLRQNRGAWHLAAERGVGAAELDALKARRNERYAALLAEGPRVMDGALDTLRRLRDLVPVMGVVTSSRRDHFDVIHRQSGLLGYLDFVVADGDYARSKPDPEPYLVGLARAGVGASACVAVEDSLRGYAAARAAGLRCLVIPGPFRQDLPVDAEIIKGIRDVPRVLSLRKR